MRRNGKDRELSPTTNLSPWLPDYTLDVSVDVLKMIIDLLDPGSTVCLALTNKRYYQTVLFLNGRHRLKDVFPKPPWPFTYYDFKDWCMVKQIDNMRPGLQQLAGYYAMLIQRLFRRLGNTHRICSRDAKWIPKGRKHKGCHHCLTSYKKTRDQPSHNEMRRLRRWQREADGKRSRSGLRDNKSERAT